MYVYCIVSVCNVCVLYCQYCDITLCVFSVYRIDFQLVSNVLSCQGFAMKLNQP